MPFCWQEDGEPLSGRSDEARPGKLSADRILAARAPEACRAADARLSEEGRMPTLPAPLNVEGLGMGGDLNSAHR